LLKIFLISLIHRNKRGYVDVLASGLSVAIRTGRKLAGHEDATMAEILEQKYTLKSAGDDAVKIKDTGPGFKPL
jgi:hypothetical protein